MSKMFEFSVKTNSPTEVVKIDHLVNQALESSGVKDGICEVFVPHTTAAVTINEGADPSVVRDFLYEINKIVPLIDGYHHVEGNSAAHIKSTLVGCSETVIVENGRAKMGTWQSIFFCEFDGPRNRRVWIKII